MPVAIESRYDTRLAALLSIASLALWFGLGFPWDHHNESLVWVKDMAGRPLCDALGWHPIQTIQSWRPLGTGMAWLGWALSDGIWLQQLLNFAITAGAWWLAVRASNARLAFGLVALVAQAGLFSPYIYLFHLHGVFYGPLLLFLAWLLVRERERAQDAEAAGIALLLATATVAAAFHTFALLIFAGYLGAAWLEAGWRQRRLVNPLPAGLAIAGAALLTLKLVSGSSDLASGDPVLGLLTSYRSLELNLLLSVLTGALAVLAAVVAGLAHRASLVLLVGLASVTLLVAVGLRLGGLPVIFAWIAVCALRAAFEQRLRLLALIGLCALLPVATSTGSPTYTVFVLMPCLLVTVDGLALPPARQALLRGAGLAAGAGCLALLALLRLEVPVPVVDKLALPLRAEAEKTHQLRAVFDWLVAHPALSGRLALCSPSDFPVKFGNPMNRQLRAPTPDWPFEQYLGLIAGDRLLRAEGPQLRLCFGGEQPEGSELLQDWPGRWAGAAKLVRLAAP